MYGHGDKTTLAKPAPLVLCGGDQDLPWVETASHLGHMLHKSVTIDHNTSVARATFIDQSIETCQAFNFASPVELFRALQVFCCSHYGSMLWNLQDGSAKQYFRSWTAVKLAWACPRWTQSYLVQQDLACGAINAETDLMARYCKFFPGLCQSPSTAVSILC